MNLSGSKTEKNLLKTFADKSRTYTKYSLFAEKALEEGLDDIAMDFAEIAKEEFAHAREAYRRYLALVKDTSENLNNSIKCEDESCSELYRKFEKDALEEGFEDLTNFFKQLANVEREHSKILKESKYDVKDNNIEAASWKCDNCGNITHSKDIPEFCELCRYPKDYMILIEQINDDDYEPDDYESDDYRYSRQRPGRRPGRRPRRRPYYRPFYKPFRPGFSWWMMYPYFNPFWFRGESENTGENDKKLNDNVFWG